MPYKPTLEKVLELQKVLECKQLIMKIFPLIVCMKLMGELLPMLDYLRPRPDLVTPSRPEGTTDMTEPQELFPATALVSLCRFWSLEEKVGLALNALPDRERRVVQLRFGLLGSHPQTLAKVGEELGVTRERVRQIEKKGTRRLWYLVIEDEGKRMRQEEESASRKRARPVPPLSGKTFTAMKEEPEVLTAREAMRLIRVSQNTLYSALRRGDIPFVRIGRAIRIPKAALMELLQGKRGRTERIPARTVSRLRGIGGWVVQKLRRK